jgi:FAD/FMN-containing dehydrogenase
MTLPPGMSQQDFSEALRRFETAVGKDWVFSAAEDVALYRDAYSPFWDEEEERTASAAVAPDTVEQVQAVVRIANQHRIPIYPISTGRNLAYGGAAPVLSGSVVLDLKRMNRVLEVSEENASALVEPGVSYFDLYRHIQDRNLKLMIDVPTPGWGSLVGNALDHGAGVTPMRDHWSTQCGLEVVLANGEVLRTGTGALPGAKTWQQYKYGLGPYLDGIFSQSSFGVITKMGFWLLPEPEVVRALRVTAPRHDDVIKMVEIMSHLTYSGVVDSQFTLTSPVLHGPRDAELEAMAARPGGGTAEEWDRYAESKDQPFWSVRFTFYGPQPIVDARWEYARQRYAAIPGAQFEDGPTYRFPMTREQREAAPDKGMLGIPSLQNFFGRTPATPEVADGHMDFSVVVPMAGRDVLAALKTIGRNFAAGGVGARMGAVSSFHLRTFIVISSFPLMRNDVDFNRRVRAAYESAVKVTAENGWGQYRSHAAFMDLAMSKYSFNDNVLSRFHATLKDAVDPNGILSAGRYGIWPKSMRGSG